MTNALTQTEPAKSEGSINEIFFQTLENSSHFPWIALLMGYSGSSDSWGQTFIGKLSKFFNLVLIDNRGTGRSVKVDDTSDFSIKLFAEDTVRVVEKIGKPVVLFGLSLGGCIVQEVINIKPAWLRGSALLSTTAGGVLYTPPSGTMLEQLSAPQGETIFDKSMAIWHLCMNEEALTKNLGELTAIHEAQLSRLTPRTTFKGQMQAFRKFANTSSSDLPTFIFAGKSDRLMPPENSRSLQGLYANSSLVELEGVEHMPYLECPNVLVEEMRKLCSRAL